MESGCGSQGVCNICPIISRRSIGFAARLKHVGGPGTMSSGRIGRWRSRLQVHRQTPQVTQVCSSECKEMVLLQKEIYFCAVAGGVLCLSRGEGKGAVNPKKRKYILHVCPTGTPPDKEKHYQAPFPRPCLPVTVPSASRSSLAKLPAVRGRSFDIVYGDAVGLRVGNCMRPMPMDH